MPYYNPLKSGIKTMLSQHTVTEKSKRRKHTSDSPLEALRIERTNLSQDELAIYCGIPRATYQRWVSGRTEARPTLRQLKLLCQRLGIEHIDQLPEEFGPPSSAERN
ncbi:MULTISPECIES: helix-turn-helix transcriptional regulator [Moorena]|uniref:Helix-turn-helix transcriptional regulator n=3 Tax=Moorena TaxID=1155738 RepID=A0A1D9GAG6_MOOP1|nr:MULTISPECIES: helix-turn-helix transcriptional regulator [Moorena]AOY84629.2 helix-turn-helix transcriptional regulator [Moorena producens JHB]EGJ29732.1 helix-turn-helix protein [Moorena producens 3L]